ncbi:hypothetical protein DPMN_050175 [Dreissena polymorpha]|uniref:Uncharacterized protein n=1 Tax=Dreissena polymorpha TaxID=45954 RepID=A0A9D4HM07_DREPO|nr:hypothetical protein DPMN_050175 [Dreissena polymorpha]
MKKALYDHHIYISIDGKPISSLRCADDIDLVGGTRTEQQDLANRRCYRAGAYGKRNRRSW